MRAYERLLKYVKVHTTSDPNSGTHPSTLRQFDLAKILVEELKELGLTDFRVVSNCGEQAGQSVHHLHFHVLAGRDMTWPPG